MTYYLPGTFLQHQTVCLAPSSSSPPGTSLQHPPGRQGTLAQEADHQAPPAPQVGLDLVALQAHRQPELLPLHIVCKQGKNFKQFNTEVAGGGRVYHRCNCLGRTGGFSLLKFVLAPGFIALHLEGEVSARTSLCSPS